MFDATWLKTIGIGLLGGALLIGCPAPEDDEDASPSPAEETQSPAPNVTPEPLYFDSSDTYTWYECDATSWYYELMLVGMAEEYPWVETYDHTAWSDWAEVHTLDSMIDHGGDSATGGFYEVYAAEPMVTDINTYGSDEEAYTIFDCDNIGFLNFVFYAFDYKTGDMVCAGIGPDVEDLADPACDLLVL